MSHPLRACVLAAVALGAGLLRAQSAADGTYLGFDRNQYPGDENLRALRRTFAYAGYWLNNPPGERGNSWIGKRATLRAAGYGFLVIFNGRLYQELKRNPQILGQADAQSAIASAQREGFPHATVIFLDIEEGGRMLAEQKAYIYAWVDGLAAGAYHAGVYCSGMPASEGRATIVTAEDIRANAQGRKIVYWVTNDACPPSPGCAFPEHPPRPSRSGVPFADLWQFAQSPRRKTFTSQCVANYDRDGNCYPPGVERAPHLHVDVDVNTSTAADPSRGR
ncbi:MAG: DUF1906 domain-containing protein [Acidobacteria bacterium]|nr:DUF1906 domain-containing protein [Acidobacteriota bacterium]